MKKEKMKRFADHRTIYQEGSRETCRRYVDISIENHLFRMNMQDLWPSCCMDDEDEGDNEYERCISNVATEPLMAALSVTEERDLMDRIEADYGRADALDCFCTFLMTHHLKYDYWAG